jgi:hypothetical protein
MLMMHVSMSRYGGSAGGGQLDTSFKAINFKPAKIDISGL